MSKWQFQFNDSILNEKFGPVFAGGRRGARGEWKQADDLPEFVRQYLTLIKVSNRWHFTGPDSCADLKKQITEAGTSVNWQRSKAVSLRGTVQIEDPIKPPKPLKIPHNIPAIRSLADLLDYFGADSPSNLNRRIYKNTDCGASISIETPDGKWHHCGGDWKEITKIVAFTIQTIVEGSEATIDSDTFVLPVTVESVDRWIEDMESQASDLWEEANGEGNNE